MMGPGVMLAAGLAAIGVLAPSSPPPLCARVTRAVPAGTVLTASDLVGAPCDRAVDSRVLTVYDATTDTARAGRDLHIGDVIGAVPTFALAAVRPGEHLFLETQVGPVHVEREVEAVQAVRPGQRLFVRAGKDVFSARFSPGAPR